MAVLFNCINMKRKLPITINEIQIYTYNKDEKFVDIKEIPFDKRSDFIADGEPGGIAVKITTVNERYDSGVRRDVRLTLVDMTERYEVAMQNVRVNLRKWEWFRDIYAEMPATEMKPGHTYKLLVSDANTSEALAEKVVHYIDKERLPHPTEWYEVCDGGLRPAWEDNIYKTIQTEDGQMYYVRFGLSQKLGYLLSPIMPELELRLYSPEGSEVIIQFREPRCANIEDYKDNMWFVEFPFTSSYDSHGVYYAELLCMEYPIAGFAFDNDVEDEKGNWFGDYLKPLDEYTPDAAIERWSTSPAREEDRRPAEPDDFDRLLDQFIAEEKTKTGDKTEEPEQENEADNEPVSLLPSLDNLTGLRSVKDKLTVYERVVRFNRMRADKGLPTTDSPLHAMFLGSPGTGKTTVAKMMGAMLHRAGVLSKGHVVVQERATLLGQNYNSEAEKTLEAIEKAQGGILFIDEAYQLYQPNDARDPGKFVIETLLTALADESNRDWMLVLAGYPDEMRRMFDMNPGFKSRIPDSNIYRFDDFTENELVEIAEKYLTRHQYSLSDDARTALCERLRCDYSSREKNFGNARHVINMIQTEIIPSMAMRVTGDTVLGENALTEIKSVDIPCHTTPQKGAARTRVGFI